MRRGEGWSETVPCMLADALVQLHPVQCSALMEVILIFALFTVLATNPVIPKHEECG